MHLWALSALVWITAPSGPIPPGLTKPRENVVLETLVRALLQFQNVGILFQKLKGIDMTISSSSLTRVRPYQVLSIPDEFGEEIKFFMPPPSGAGSLKTIESIMLLKLMRSVNPSYIFEFGTFKGYTTRLLLENLPDSNVRSERIYTLDLPSLHDVIFQGGDKEHAIAGLNFPKKYLTSPRKNLVKQILQDSMTFDPRPYLKKFQYIFIDANHEVNYVKRDTENSFKMLADPPSCIVWHDYENPEYPQLTQYLKELSSKIRLHHIEDTMLVFHLLGREVAPPKVSSNL
jgi:hypothetical protein